MNKRRNRWRVVIVESNDYLRNSFRVALSREEGHDHVAAYGTCESCLTNLRDDRPDIVLVDLECAGGKVADGVKEILRFDAAIRVVILTDQIDIQNILTAFTAGATGYLCKSEVIYLDSFLRVLGEIKEGRFPLSESVTRSLVLSFKKKVTTALTDREIEILGLLRKGNTSSEIAATLGISKFTVRAHMRNIYDKLNVTKKSQALRLAEHEQII